MSTQEYVTDLNKLRQAVEESSSKVRKVFYQSMIETRVNWIKESKGSKMKKREDLKMKKALKDKQVQRVCERLRSWV